MHNPFVRYEYTAAFIPAPDSYKGGVLPTEEMMLMSLGINDYRYAYTLEQELARARREGKKAGICAEVDQYLASLKAEIPVLPDISGLAAEDDLAAVGQGVKGAAAEKLDEYRRKIAGYVAELKK